MRLTASVADSHSRSNAFLEFLFDPLPDHKLHKPVAVFSGFAGNALRPIGNNIRFTPRGDPCTLAQLR